MPFCDICKTSIKSRFKRHMECHNTNKSYVCEICHYTYTTQKQLECHIKSKHSTRLLTCFCNQKFNNVNTLIIHYRSHTKEKPFVCNVCRTLFRQSAHLKKHCLSQHNVVLSKDDYQKEGSVAMTRTRAMLWLLIKHMHEKEFDDSKSLSEIMSNMIGLTYTPRYETVSDFIKNFKLFIVKYYPSNTINDCENMSDINRWLTRILHRNKIQLYHIIRKPLH
uniref:C2H2-type domain-containing protein n=1 Tax=Nesodiprion zhejiangensis nucleopolyhedrovirus TaxID=3135970 RepID=A0AAN0LPU8_9BACU